VLLKTADVGDQELAAIANLTTTGFLTRTADNSYATRTIQTPNDGLSVADGDGVGGDPTLTLTNDLSAVEGLTGTGLAARTATDTWTERTFQTPNDGLSVADGDGVNGDPTLTLSNDLAALEGLASGGFAVRTGADTWEIRVINGTSGEVTVDDPDGSAGDLTIGLPSTVTATLTFSGVITFSNDVEVQGAFDHNNTSATRIARGTTAERPSGQAGDIRWNESNNQYEGYNSADGSWGPLGGAGLYKGENGERGDTVSGAGDIFRINEQTLNTDVTIESGENASCAGPLTIASGVTLTVNGNLTIV
jgi:hypothetical protein